MFCVLIDYHCYISIVYTINYCFLEFFLSTHKLSFCDDSIYSLSLISCAKLTFSIAAMQSETVMSLLVKIKFVFFFSFSFWMEFDTKKFELFWLGDAGQEHDERFNT